MTDDEKKRFFNIRCDGKRGRIISDEDSLFLRKMCSIYPSVCKELEAEAFEATKPFGAM